MSRKLHHHNLDLPDIAGLNRESDVEVWDDDPNPGQPAHVTLCLAMDAHTDLTPNEARALAAMLINAAEHQDRRSALSSGGSNHG